MKAGKTKERERDRDKGEEGGRERIIKLLN